MHPAVWGAASGRSTGDEQVRLDLVESETFDSGVTLLRYSRVAS